MQSNFMMFVLLASIYLMISIIASPIGNNRRDKRMLVKEPTPIRVPGGPVYHFCGYIGDTCADDSNCCSTMHVAYQLAMATIH